MIGWRYAEGCVTGTSHTTVGTPCQDTCRCCVLNTAEGEVLVAIASDGAGSATRSEEGADIACSTLKSNIEQYFGEGGKLSQVDRSFFEREISRVRAQIEDVSAREGLVPRDYACTILVAIVGDQEAAFAQIGDGVIIVAPLDEPEQYHWQFWPQKGEYQNTTSFITDQTALEHLEFGNVNHAVCELAVLTDGLERLALQMDQRVAHGPFFAPMFRAVRAEPNPGLSESLSAALEEFLCSESVCRRTDDDKTLILASRFPPIHDQATDTIKESDGSV